MDHAPPRRSSYQRIPAWSAKSPTATVWFSISVSWAPKLLYSRRYIKRSAITSSRCAVPCSGMQASLPPDSFESNGEVFSTSGPVKVEAEGVAQFTWNWKTCSWSVGQPSALSFTSTKEFGVPAGGGGPSRSEGSRPPKLEFAANRSNETIAAGCPESILVRSNAQAPWPPQLQPSRLHW